MNLSSGRAAFSPFSKQVSLPPPLAMWSGSSCTVLVVGHGILQYGRSSRILQAETSRAVASSVVWLARRMRTDWGP